MHGVTRAGARAAVASLLAIPLVVLGAGVASAAPGITLDPAGTLAAASTVTVTATGFAPGTTVVVAECRPGEGGAISSPQQCADPVTGSSAVAVADAQGSLTARITVTVGDIRSGVSCTTDGCVIAAVSTVSTAQQALAPVTLTGAASSLPAPTATPSATSSASPAPSASEPGGSTATPEATGTDTAEPSAEATEAASTEPAAVESSAGGGNSGAKPGTLARTGAEDAWRSLVVGLVALQVGLVVAVRLRRTRPAGAVVVAGGRHRR